MEKRMAKLSFGKKMTLSMALFTVPICVLSYMMFKVQTTSIDFAAQEKLGVQYQRPLEKILHAVSLHKIMAQRALHGETESKNKLSSLSEGVDQGLSELQKVNAEIGSNLQFTSEGLKMRKRDGADFNSLSARWEKLKSDMGKFSPAESNEAHNQMISTVRTMITHLGDTSNIILDPDLDSYYVGDITIGGLPQNQDRIQDIISQVEIILRKKTITNIERVQVAVYTSMLKEADLARILSDSQSALNEDPNFYGISESFQKNYPPAIKDYQDNIEKLLSLMEKISTSENSAVNVDEFLQVAQASLDNSYKLWETGAAELNSLLEKRIAILSSERLTNLVIVLFVLLLSCGFSIQSNRSLTRTISAVTESLGHSEQRVQSSSEQLSASGATLSESSTEAAASLQETVASLEELTSMVRLNSENAKQAATLSSSARDSALTGETEILSLITSMNQISESSKKIEEIIQVIDDIAFQTNLLALNAAVEAARAGEQGKGFAVVAEAVRTLAQRSAASAKDISSLIKESVEQIGKGSKIADQSGEVLSKIVTSIKKVSELNTEMATANAEQTSGIEQISKAMNQLDQAGQKNAASAEEIAATSEVMLTESNLMHGHVGDLKQVIGINQ
jgi:methyl-accepting chemotaxis protein